MVGWDHRPRPRVAQTAHRCSSAARSASIWPGRMPAPRSWRPAADARGRRRRADRPLDAGDRHPRPHLLPGELLRDAGQAVAGCPTTDRPRYRTCQGRSGRSRMRHGAAVVRPLRDDRAPGVDRRGVATVDHRAGQRERRRAVWRGSRATTSTRSAIWQPHSAFPTRRWPTGRTSTRSTSFQARGSFVTNPRDGFRQPGHPYRMTPAQLRPPARRHGSASTPSTTAEMEFPVGKVRASREFPRKRVGPQLLGECPQCRCRSAGCGCWT